MFCTCRALLYGGLKESLPGTQEIELQDTPSVAFSALLKYIYSGRMNLIEVQVSGDGPFFCLGVLLSIILDVATLKITDTLYIIGKLNVSSVLICAQSNDILSNILILILRFY